MALALYCVCLILGSPFIVAAVFYRAGGEIVYALASAVVYRVGR